MIQNLDNLSAQTKDIAQHIDTFATTYALVDRTSKKQSTPESSTPSASNRRHNIVTQELKSIAEFIRDTGKDIPWHISRFHPDYKYTKTPPTPLETLKNAESIGKKAGLKYIYLGNVAKEGNTYCSACGKLLIGRAGYAIAENGIKMSKCPECTRLVEGVW